MGPLMTSKTEYGPGVQDAVAWRGEGFLRGVGTTPNALPAFTILQEEVSMISSCLTQGLLIAENAG
ncbi:hypothetical protein SynM161_02282 [Synechococcus sp. M16.1]|nr:hypothetical protein SynM161_02282 [Synechococcus sp. M16.1]